jgi:hypothetical protein
VRDKLVERPWLQLHSGITVVSSPLGHGLIPAALLALGERKNGKGKEGGSTVVEHPPHHPKVMGLNLAAAGGTIR